MGYFRDVKLWCIIYAAFVLHESVELKYPSLVSVNVTNKIKNFIRLFYGITCFMGFWNKDRAYMLFIEFNLFCQYCSSLLYKSLRGKLDSNSTCFLQNLGSNQNGISIIGTFHSEKKHFRLELKSFSSTSYFIICIIDSKYYRWAHHECILLTKQ